jgi:hypothetical protein
MQNLCQTIRPICTAPFRPFSSIWFVHGFDTRTSNYSLIPQGWNKFVSLTGKLADSCTQCHSVIPPCRYIISQKAAGKSENILVYDYQGFGKLELGVKVMKGSILFCCGFFGFENWSFCISCYSIKWRKIFLIWELKGNRGTMHMWRHQVPLHWIFTLSNRARSPASFLDAAKLKIVKF